MIRAADTRDTERIAEQILAAIHAAEAAQAKLDRIAAIVNGYRPYREMVEEITAILVASEEQA